MRLRRFKTSSGTSVGTWVTECGRFRIQRRADNLKEGRLRRAIGPVTSGRWIIIAEAETAQAVAERIEQRAHFLITNGIDGYVNESDTSFATRKEALAALDLALQGAPLVP